VAHGGHIMVLESFFNIPPLRTQFFNSKYLLDEIPVSDKRASIVSTATEHTLTIAIPGRKIEDITIDVDDDVVRVKAPACDASVAGCSEFDSTWFFNNAIDVSATTASYVAGMLRIVMPVVGRAEKKTRRIAIT